jgi:hypothetical protein
MARPTLRKQDFANIDARVRCPTEDCWGELLLMPVGAGEEGFPVFAEHTVCPLCMGVFDIEQDMSDRDLYLRVSWLRANPHEAGDG